MSGVYRALVYFRPNDFGGVSHVKFRQMLAHALLTLGKIPFGEEPPEEKAADTEAGHEEKFCQLTRFEAYKNKKHQCGFCEHKAYWYCETCFPDPSSVQAQCLMHSATWGARAAHASPNMCWDMSLSMHVRPTPANPRAY